VTTEPRRFPVLATLLVLVAIGVMVRLGLWQIDRLHQKEALLARYAAAQSNAAPVSVDDLMRAARLDELLYRRVHLDCPKVFGFTSIAGRSAHDEAGYAHVAQCVVLSSMVGDVQINVPAEVVLGWSMRPEAPKWSGGAASGIIVQPTPGKPDPRNPYLARIIADPPLAGLAANAKPDPAHIPNNHLSYAVQWFLFAGTALVIYAIALWRRLSAGN